MNNWFPYTSHLFYSDDPLKQQWELLNYGDEFIAWLREDYKNNPLKYSDIWNFTQRVVAIWQMFDNHLDYYKTEDRWKNIFKCMSLSTTVADSLANLYEILSLNNQGGINNVKKRLPWILTSVMNRWTLSEDNVTGYICENWIHNFTQFQWSLKAHLWEWSSKPRCPAFVKWSNLHVPWINNAIDFIMEIHEKR